MPRPHTYIGKGYYVDTVGKNTKAIKTYIAEQLKREQESNQYMGDSYFARK